ncbi:MAG: glutamine-hydrolyzing carbamoyl-phosphate synthase small subunit, partial [Gemmatimonadetes bacterium]|nr:glutamine-hydrolyzing carbamoyl-phosphate synthase small subunit [Gemmatimonadota bacterium]
IVFTTNLTGYQEVLTDPSFAGQIVVMTAPMIGNYGVTGLDAQSRRPWVAGFIVRELSGARDGWRTEGSLPAYLEQNDIPTLVGVDTRAVTRHVRELGAMRGLIVPATWSEERALERLRAEPPMQGRDLATGVTTPEPYEIEAVGEERGLVVCLDYGVKQRSLDLIASAGFRVRVEPVSAAVREILTLQPAGVFVSNGPGDPEAIPGAPEKLRDLAAAGLPIFGICLGCQLIARAFGGSTWKLPYGHRGGNHPVRNLDTGAVEITSQNHGFAIVGEGDEVAGAPALRVTHRNLNDGTIEGVAHSNLPVFAVQYHPEAAPGPHDSRYLFDRFVEAMSASIAPATG